MTAISAAVAARSSESMAPMRKVEWPTCATTLRAGGASSSADR